MIGLFDETDVIDALLPACLKNGANPASFNSGNIPVYNGPQGITRTATLVNCESGYGYKDNGTIELDGVNDYLEMSAHVARNISALSFSWWGKISKNSSCLYVELQASGSSRFIIFVDSAGKLVMATRQGTTANLTTSANVVSKDTLHHIVGIYNATGLIQQLWVDNALAIAPTAILNAPTTDASYLLPAYGFSTALPFGGIMSSGVFYGKALTESEISALYTLGPDLGGLKMYADGRLVAPNRRKQHGLNVGISLSL